MRKVVVLVFIFLPILVLAQTTSQAPTYVRDIDYTLEQPFGGQDNISNLAEYVNVVYAFAVGIVGIIAVVLIMFGGLRWIAAAGNESIITEAKEIITAAITGLAIALLSFVLLSFINPQFTSGKLGVPVIVIAPEKSIIDLDKCDSANFKGKTCTDPDTSSQMNCEEISCGSQGFVDGNYCRGITCASGTGGCYRGPADPMAYSCQNTYCGQYAQNCAETGYKSYPSAEISFTSAFNECTCPYYEDVVAKDLGMRDLHTSVLSDEQEAIFFGFCTETNTQEYWEAAIAAEPSTYGYTFTASSTVSKGWNCGFTCYNDAGKYDYTGGNIDDPLVNCAPNG